jgi:hypothetical protein
MTVFVQDRPRHFEPIAGPHFRAAARAPLSPGDHERDRRRLLALIAGYQDAGHAPAVIELVRRLRLAGSGYIVGNGQKRARRIDGLLRALERDGLLIVHWGDKSKRERNRYELRLGGGDHE